MRKIYFEFASFNVWSIFNTLSLLQFHVSRIAILPQKFSLALNIYTILLTLTINDKLQYAIANLQYNRRTSDNNN